MPISIGIGEQVELPETKQAFRCAFAFHKGALLVFVKERRLNFDEGQNKYVAHWFILSSVAVLFSVSRALARRIVERHLDFYDVELAGTLAPAWAAWDDVPIGEPSAGQAQSLEPVTMN